jgi:alanine racemase
MGKYHRTYTIIDESVIRNNFLAMKGLVPNYVKMLAVVKADAYGHGAVETANELKDIADYFAVATIDEAVELRKAGINNEILILGFVSHEDYFNVIEYNVMPVIFNLEDAAVLNSLAARRNKQVKIHLAVDTGMGRIGFKNDEESIKNAREIFNLKNIIVEGVFSHFACADEPGREFTDRQNEVFKSFIDALGKKINVVHISNSAGIVEYPEYRYDMVRDGISLYGYYPSDYVNKNKITIKPALEWHAHVTHVKKMHKGDTISYGATYVLDGDKTVATVSVGYADGYPRLMSNKGEVIIKGCLAPILGRVCMDQLMVDVTNIPDVLPEDDVILIGKDGDAVITADDIAKHTGTISYEVLCDITKRVTRLYK